jgi:hypothetical protein
MVAKHSPISDWLHLQVNNSSAPKVTGLGSIYWVSGSLSLVIHDHEYSRACPIRLATSQLLAPVLSEKLTTKPTHKLLLDPFQRIAFSFSEKMKRYFKASKNLKRITNLIDDLPARKISTRNTLEVGIFVQILSSILCSLEGEVFQVEILQTGKIHH